MTAQAKGETIYPEIANYILTEQQMLAIHKNLCPFCSRNLHGPPGGFGPLEAKHCIGCGRVFIRLERVGRIAEKFGGSAPEEQPKETKMTYGLQGLAPDPADE